MRKEDSSHILGRSGCLGLMITLLSFAPTEAKSKEYRLRASCPFPPAAVPNQFLLIPLAKEIEKATNGAVKIRVHTGTTLGKAEDHLNMVSTGIVDIAISVQAYNAGRFPLSSVVELPFLANSSGTGTQILWGLYDKFPEFREEYKDFKVMALFCYSVNQLLMAKRPVHTLADIKGLKIRGTGQVLGEMIKLMGAVPLSMPAPELYESLDKGIIDGVLFGYASQRGFRLYEVIKHATTADLFVGPLYLVMNRNVWNSLPPDIQKAIDGLIGTKASMMAVQGYYDEDEGAVKDLLKAGVKMYAFAEQERNKWKELCRPLWGNWVNQMNAKGLPGQKILDESVRIAEKYKK